MPVSHIVLNIKYLRRKNNFTQSKLGEFLGVSDSQVTNYEKGKSSPPLDSVLKMCELFNVALEDFVYKNLEYQNYSEKTELKSELTLQNTEGCMMAGGCVLRRVAEMEELLKQKA
jgi:transcriptional regulator with XRE-family HTH domain